MHGGTRSVNIAVVRGIIALNYRATVRKSAREKKSNMVLSCLRGKTKVLLNGKYLPRVKRSDQNTRTECNRMVHDRLIFVCFARKTARVILIILQKVCVCIIIYRGKRPREKESFMFSYYYIIFDRSTICLTYCNSMCGQTNYLRCRE